MHLFDAESGENLERPAAALPAAKDISPRERVPADG